MLCRKRGPRRKMRCFQIFMVTPNLKAVRVVVGLNKKRRKNSFVVETFNEFPRYCSIMAQRLFSLILVGMDQRSVSKDHKNLSTEAILWVNGPNQFSSRNCFLRRRNFFSEDKNPRINEVPIFHFSLVPFTVPLSLSWNELVDSLDRQSRGCCCCCCCCCTVLPKGRWSL